MFGKKSCEVLVVGAGPVGLMTALCLARRGVQVHVIDEGWRGGAHSYALALHPHSLSLLGELGLADAVIARGRRVDTVEVLDGVQTQATLKLGALSGEYPFVLVLRQDVLESMLVERLEAQGVRVDWEQRLAEIQSAGGRCSATVHKMGKSSGGYAVATTELVIEKSRRFDSDFVVGADGHRSIVRRVVGAEFPETAATEAFAVFEFSTDPKALSAMKIVLNDDNANVLWPMPDGYCRWSFQLTEPIERDEPRQKSRLAVQIGTGAYPSLTERHLLELLQQRAPWFDARVGEINWSMVVQFQRRLATQAGHGRCWLAGDALHLTSPVGVQSMNVGLREAHDLAWALAEILRGGGSPNLLEAYGRGRRAEWEQLLGLAAVPTVDDGAAGWVQANAGRVLPCIPASGYELAALVEQMGARLALPQSAFELSG